MLFLLLSSAALLRAPLRAEPPVVLRAPIIAAVESWYDKQQQEKLQKQAAQKQQADAVLAFQEKTADLLAERRFAQAQRDLEASVNDQKKVTDLWSLKADLIDLAAKLNRGAGCTEEEQQQVEALASRLEAQNPNPSPLTSPLINGRWQLAYTTSASILGTNRRMMKPVGPIFQTLDVPTLTAKNEETVRFLWFKLKRSVQAAIEPVLSSVSKVIVRFQLFRIGFLRIKAPKTAIGELDTTYLDSELRISRGDKGNIFVLFKNEGLTPLAA